ncbi:LacI family DNA-binding transcriptional regulator [Actinobacillus capsulatus]|uniref:LacI family DNA-binding transcriptional regulator n=1 Tax=Actinobacillus capsulatus TaxID=717 RepID=UPI00036764CB|nr:LacI family DNA-binding transcriptional regulator [Actinobacillus capsulatus]
MESKPKKRLTLNDIAALSGVSKTTASMILNGKSDDFRIKSETRQKVQAIAEQYGYRANVYAKALQAQRSNVIGLVIPDLTNYGFASTARNLEKLCRENGLQLVIACSDDNPQQEKLVIERLLDRQVDLLITAPTHQDPNYYQKIIRHTPVLHIDRHIPNLELNYIISDDTPSVAKLVENIVRAYQPKEFFYLGGQLSLSPSASRLEGFYEGLEQSHLVAQSSWILHKDYQPESGYQMFAEIVERLGRLPEAVFTASYTILEGVLRYLTEHKQMAKLMNQELHLATFDDHHLLDALPFHIHSIAQDHEQIALKTFQLIREKLQRKAINNAKVDCEIIWRH